MIKAVIFDMYETLITHYAAALYHGRQIAADMELPEGKFREIWNPTDTARTLGQTEMKPVLERILRENGRYSDALLDAILRKRHAFDAGCFRHLHPEILPMLDAIHRKGLQIGLVTNCYLEERDLIRESVLMPYFDAVCMSCELGMMKPDPAIFRRCTEMLDVQPGECLYVGDGGSRELETAGELGMHPVQAVWYFSAAVQDKRKREFVQAESPMEVSVLAGETDLPAAQHRYVGKEVL